MGILDEAIKEHLDLKRRQGAGDAEIQRLEDEAFGPPSRPGDPDFPEQEPASEPGTAEADQLAPEAEAPSEEMAAEPQYAEEEPSEGAPVAEAPAEAPPEAEPAEQPQTEEGDRAGFYDAEAEEAEEELDLDLELDIDSEIENVGDLDVEEEPASPSGEDAPAISQLDTVEHHFEDAIDDAEVVEDEPPADQTGSAEPEAEAGEGAEDSEDVLEETPEFLQDAPEDDELWFEQGEPKDFDF
jgi:hypothetical protein